MLEAGEKVSLATYRLRNLLECPIQDLARFRRGLLDVVQSLSLSLRLGLASLEGLSKIFNFVSSGLNLGLKFDTLSLEVLE